KIKPFEIIIVDGGSTDGTNRVISRFTSMNITHVYEKDEGIYDAMNKGRMLAKGDLIHYLNAGDSVIGDIYKNIKEPCLIKVGLFENDKLLGFSSITHSNTGYCHQGVIFPKNHSEYDLRYKICADYKLIQEVFPEGLRSLSLITSGYVKYDMGGVSSKKRILRDKELAKIMFEKNKKNLIKFIPISIIKILFPERLRRVLRKMQYICLTLFFMKNSSPYDNE
ncbi:glycosyltransferase, partial [Escherichia coli]